LKVDKKSFETTNCIVCDVDDTHKVSKRGQFGFPAHVVICRQCGLTYLNPRWNKKRLNHFYENEYDDYYRPDMNDTEKKSAYIPIYERLKSKNFQIDNMSRILDIGSGAGYNLKFLIDKIPDAEFYAIEPSPECRNTLKEMNVKILGTDVEQKFDPKHNGYFDLIIMRHVLEHFGNPIKVLEQVMTLLKDDGILYIAVPNSLYYGKYTLQNHFFRMVHTYYFSIHSLKNVFNKAGLNTIWMEEGDDYNDMELYTVVRKGEVKEPLLNKKNYDEQKKIYQQYLKVENSPIVRLKKLVKSVRSKVRIL